MFVPTAAGRFSCVDEEEMTASDWVSLGGQAVDEKRDTGRPGVLPASISRGMFRA